MQEKILAQLERLAYEEGYARPSEQLAALKLLGQHCGMWEGAAAVPEPYEVTVRVLEDEKEPETKARRKPGKGG